MLQNCHKQNGVGFVAYEVGNTLPMSKPHRMRLYELLKRSETKGYVTIPLDDLKLFMGLKDKYADVRNFNRLLNADLAEINDHTDLTVTYTKKGKGKGGAIAAYNFTITNKNASEEDAESPNQPKKPKKPKSSKKQNPSKPIKGQTSLFIHETEDPEYISLIRGNLARGERLSAEEIDFLYQSAKQSIWAQSIPYFMEPHQRSLKIAAYIKFQETYTLAQLKDPNAYYAYLRDAVRENWANMLSES